MYRIYDKTEATRRVQTYLRKALKGDVYVAPSGIYDENTRLSVIKFQENNSLTPSGVVDKVTFDLLYLEFLSAEENKENTLIDFPILPGERSRGMIHINRALAALLNRYGHTHNLRSGSNFYTNETEEAVKIMRKIYALDYENLIDRELYNIIMLDLSSIEEINDKSRYY